MLEADAILSKISIIKNCLRTIKLATGLDPEKLDDTIPQDVFVLNLQRAAQASIDMANLVIADKGLSLPTSYKQGFQILFQNGLIPADVRDKMMKMAGFRNISIHDYRLIDPEILKSIMKHHLGDFEEFYSAIYRLYR